MSLKLNLPDFLEEEEDFKQKDTWLTNVDKSQLEISKAVIELFSPEAVWIEEKAFDIHGREVPSLVSIHSEKIKIENWRKKIEEEKGELIKKILPHKSSYIDEVLKETEFVTDLKEVIKRHSRENKSDTPDYLLAIYLNDCLSAYERAVNNKRINHELTSGKEKET